MEKDYQNNVNSEGNQSAKNRFTFVDFSIRDFGRLNVSDSVVHQTRYNRVHHCRPVFQ